MGNTIYNVMSNSKLIIIRYPPVVDYRYPATRYFSTVVKCMHGGLMVWL